MRVLLLARRQQDARGLVTSGRPGWVSEPGIARAAVVDRHRAAGMEAAAARDPDRIRGLAVQDLGLLPLARVAARHDGQERLRVRVLRVAERPRAAGPCSTIRPRYMTAIRSANSAAVERSCVIIRTASPLCRSPSRSFKHAGADRDVEHRDRLVGYEQLAARGRAPRRSQPAGAARRTARADSGRGRAPAGRARPAPAPGARASGALVLRASEPVDQQRLLDRLAHSKARVERLVRVLVDDLDPRRSGRSSRVPSARRCPDPRSGSRRRSASTSRSTACAVVVLPHPDSPTSATSSPAASASETPSTACTDALRRRRSDPTSPRGDG